MWIYEQNKDFIQLKPVIAISLELMPPKFY